MTALSARFWGWRYGQVIDPSIYRYSVGPRFVAKETETTLCGTESRIADLSRNSLQLAKLPQHYYLVDDSGSISWDFIVFLVQTVCHSLNLRSYCRNFLKNHVLEKLVLAYTLLLATRPADADEHAEK